jgi:hypothetical protein
MPIPEMSELRNKNKILTRYGKKESVNNFTNGNPFIKLHVLG